MVLTAQLWGIAPLVAQQPMAPDTPESEIYAIPVIGIAINGEFEVGVRVQGATTAKFDYTSSFEGRFTTSDEHSLSAEDRRELVHQRATDFTYKQTPKPPPSVGNFFTEIVKTATTGDASGLLPWFSGAIDYAIDPYNRDWSRTYTERTSTSTSQAQVTKDDSARKTASEWLSTFRREHSSTTTIDANAGYVHDREYKTRLS
jgi:hypothetical protein